MQIKEVSQKFQITPATLRYYERIGLIPSVPRNANGIRDYDEEAIGWVKFIQCMRSAGMPIDALREYVALYQQGSHTAAARKQLLIEQRDNLIQRMSDLQQTLDRLTMKIAHYEKNKEIDE